MQSFRMHSCWMFMASPITTRITLITDEFKIALLTDLDPQ